MLLSAPATAVGGQEPREIQMGSECTGTSQGPADTVFQGEMTSLTFWERAPFDGVVTQWTVRIGYPTVEPSHFALSVLGQVAESKRYVVEEQSPTVTAKTGETVTKTRLPIYKGERVALTSAEGTGMPICETTHPVLDNVGSAGRALKKGETATFIQLGEMVPVEAIIEEDRDRDGYGDVTQDRCPRSPRVHARRCPHAAGG
jgi:hypothetical protein